MAHQCILSGRSEYFNAMLYGNMKESAMKTPVSSSKNTNNNSDSYSNSNSNSNNKNSSPAALPEIELRDIRYEPFLTLMEYIYTDRMDGSPAVAPDVLLLADRFNVLRLKVMLYLYYSSSFHLSFYPLLIVLPFYLYIYLLF